MEDGAYKLYHALSVSLNWNYDRIAESFKIGTNIYDDGLYLSDHRPVFSDITLKVGIFSV